MPGWRLRQRAGFGASDLDIDGTVMKGDPAIGARPEALALSQATAALEAANAQVGVTAQGPTAEQLARPHGSW